MSDRFEKNVISRHLFNREVGICQQLSKENKGKCNWGKCKDCGVVPLPYKLYKGTLLENQEKIKDVKKDELNI